MQIKIVMVYVMVVLVLMIVEYVLKVTVGIQAIVIKTVLVSVLEMQH